MRNFRALTIALLVVTAPLTGQVARADQTDPRLDQLFADLKTADTEDTASAIEAKIWSIWTRSSSDPINRQMAEGVEQLATGDTDAALETFTRIIQSAPGFAEAWNKRATTLYLLGRYPESISDIGHVLALEPRHFGALSGLAMCDVELHQTQNAIDALRWVQSVDPHLRGAQENIDRLRKQLAREST